MAGKFHQAVNSHLAGTQAQLAPARREVRAYAEGFHAATAGAISGSNPHPTNTPAGKAWGQGYSDSYAGVSGLHVADAPADAAAPNPDPEFRPWNDVTTHRALDDLVAHFVVSHGLVLPVGWVRLSLQAKKDWLNEWLDPTP